MSQLELIISTFPMVFIIHEFEEIICFKTWIIKNGVGLSEKYPMLAKKVDYLRKLSVPAFSIAVFEELILVCMVNVMALTWQCYYLWIAIFTAFSFHIFIHIIQWVLIRKYIPVIVTSILSLPYLTWGSVRILEEFPLHAIMACFALGTIVAMVNLYFVHKYISQIE